MINVTVDFSAVINAAEVMQATNDTIQKIAKNNASSKINRALSEFIYAGLDKNLHKEGTAIIAQHAPHVFEWSRVVDNSTLTQSQALRDAGSRTEVFDNSNTFKPTPKLKRKLYKLSLRRTASAAFIEFLDNDELAMYDEKIEQYRTKDFGVHEFKDQALELETVKNIEKDAMVVSSRRLNGVKKPLSKKRILQRSGVRILPYSIYQRENKFRGKFQEAWEKFITSYRKGDHDKSVAQANKILAHSAGKEVSKIAAQSAVSTLALSGIRSGKLGSAGGVTFILGSQGAVRTAVMPNTKTSLGTKNKQTKIEKEATRVLRQMARQRRSS
jgi:hypothetical protein